MTCCETTAGIGAKFWKHRAADGLTDRYGNRNSYLDISKYLLGISNGTPRLCKTIAVSEWPEKILPPWKIEIKLDGFMNDGTHNIRAANKDKEKRSKNKIENKFNPS